MVHNNLISQIRGKAKTQDLVLTGILGRCIRCWLYGDNCLINVWSL